ncbi:hypothetical protein A2U01_0108995, partial [Trifolium medium]|nr:hypothetical protein [Trifolium medium]
ANFKAEVEKVRNWLKDDKEKRDGIEKELRDYIAGLEKQLKDEKDGAIKLKDALEEANTEKAAARKALEAKD